MIDPTDLIGRTFGRLTVVAYLGKAAPDWRYRCQCTCGRTKDTTRRGLMQSRVLSCGCLTLTASRRALGVRR
jgi:hypothetical protein